MAKKTEDTLLFALIEAGALGRQAALEPLRELKLVPGDDAILLWLKGNPETEFSQMMFELGLDQQSLRTILFRFQNTAIIDCTPINDGMDIDISLTDSGKKLVDGLEDHWLNIDKQLRKNLPKKKRRALKQQLHELADGF